MLDHIHDKHFTNQKCSKSTAENFAARLVQAKLATKADIHYLLEKTNFEDKLKGLDKKKLPSIKENM